MICNRYERHATVITSNRDFNEWPLVFANPLMVSATMDRRTRNEAVSARSTGVSGYHLA